MNNEQLEREFETRAIAARVGYRSEQMGLQFYSAGDKRPAWWGFQAGYEAGCAERATPDRATSAGAAPTIERLIAAIRDGVPLVEPVHVDKAMMAQRPARVVLNSGTGPLAAVHLVNIGVTGWVHNPETAKAYADGFNRAAEWMRGAIISYAERAATAPVSAAPTDERVAIRKESDAAMRLSADLVQMGSQTFYDTEYLNRDAVMKRVLKWRAEWSEMEHRYPLPSAGAPVSAAEPLTATHGPLHLTNPKTASIVEYGYNIVGYVLRRHDGDEVCLSAESAVRWLPQAHYWRLMHEQDGSLFAPPSPVQPHPSGITGELADGKELPDFAAWLAREMPAGTVIADPAWWAPRILRAATAKLRFELADARGWIEEAKLAMAMRQPQGDVLPDWFKIDGDTVLIHGARYSQRLLEDLGGALPENTPFVIDKREPDGALAICKLDWSVVAAKRAGKEAT